MPTPQDCSIGYSPEVTYKTFVAPARWVEFTEESLQWEKNIVQGAGLRVGARVPRAGRRFVPTAAGSGDFTVELAAKGMGSLWKAALGSSTSTIVGATTAYQQNHTLGDAPDSLTVQKGVVNAAGTVDAFTFLGCMVNSCSIDIPNGEIATATFSLDAGDITTAQAYVTPSYPAAPLNLFSFKDASISLGGTLTMPTTTALASMAAPVAASVRSFNVEINNNLQNERYNFGGGGRKSKPLVGMREITGSMTLEYDGTTFRDAFLNDTDMTCLVNLTGTTLAGTARPEQLQIVIPCLRFDGTLPEAAEGDMITVDMDFAVLDNTTQTPITITQTTVDTAL